MLIKELLEMAKAKRTPLKLSPDQITKLKEWYAAEKAKYSGDALDRWLDLGNASADTEEKALELLGLDQDQFEEYSESAQEKFIDFLDELDLD